MATGHRIKQHLELPWWGRWRPRPAAALQHGPWDQPGPHPAQCLRPRPAYGRFRLDDRSAAPPCGRGCGLGIGRRLRLGRILGEETLPAERERATDQRPVPTDGPVAADLKVGPAELP